MKYVERFLSIIKFYLSELYLQVPNFFRLGGFYREYYKFLIDSDGWNDSEKFKYQLTLRDRILDDATKYVPYYSPHKESKFDGLDILTKVHIKNHRAISFVSNKISLKKIKAKYTGGSTGEPLEFYNSKKASLREFAHIDCILSKFEFSNKKSYRKVFIRGAVLPGGRSVLKIGRSLYVSSFHLSKDKIPNILNSILEFDPHIINCYPSSIKELASFINSSSNSYKFNSLSLVYASSEVFSYTDKISVKKAFNSSICDHYGNSEFSVLGYQVDFEPGVFPFQYSYIELSSDNELIATSLIEREYPFLKYATNDYVVDPMFSDSGLVIGYKSIRGRTQDYITDKLGAKIYISSLNFHDDSFLGVNGYQFYQPEMGMVTMRIQADSSLVMTNLQSYLEQRLQNFTFNIAICDQLERTRVGKVKLVIKDNHK
ncbi:hypothetical protein L4C39_10145 [Vibrio clamense]|uniref:hypothetical protein n=1 Tax=Vibrio clamense TaxID=2910254 RepID=UPI003D1B32F5